MWPFSPRRKPTPPTIIEVDATHWAINDIAECISDPWHPVFAGPNVGDKLIVKEVRFGPAMFTGKLGFGLWFVGYSPIGYDAKFFRKIVTQEVEQKITRRAPVTEDA